MNAIHSGNLSLSAGGLPFNDAGTTFSSMIRAIEIAMQNNLKAMKLGSEEHNEYVSKVQEMVAHMSSFCQDFWRPSLFFSERSAYYWPNESDPHQFSPTLTAYSLRLEKEPENASSKLFYFLYYQWESHVKSHDTTTFVKHLRNGMKYWGLVRFTLADLIPVALKASLKKANSWAFCYHIMEAVVGRVKRILDFSTEQCASKSVEELKDKQQKAEWVYTKVLNILAFGVGGPGGDPASVVLMNFWFSLHETLCMYNKRPELIIQASLNSTSVFERFLLAARAFDEDFLDWPHKPKAQFGEHLKSEEMIKELTDLTNKGWEQCHVHGHACLKSKDKKSDALVRLPFNVYDIAESTERRSFHR